jgi:hypothetical protein
MTVQVYVTQVIVTRVNVMKGPPIGRPLCL